MKGFQELLLQQLKLFKRIKILLLGVVGIIALIVGFSLYYSSMGVDTLLYMQQIGNYSFYICAVFTIICFMFLTYDKKNDLNEVLDVTNRKHKYYSIIVLFILLLVISLIMFLMILYIVISNKSINQLFSIYIPSFFLNIFFPLCICLFLISLISYHFNYNKAGILLILFLLIISPLFYIELDNRILNIFLSPFHFLYQPNDFSMDYMYGLKDELYRWFIILAYIILFIGVCFISMFKSKKRTIILVITICLAGGSIIYSTKPQSTLNVQQSRNELMKQIRGVDVVPYKTYEPVNYRFGDFNFEIHLKEKLFVKGTMKLESDIKRKEFLFTLYSGYDIKKLVSNQTCQYERDGNLIKIIFDNPIDKADFQIEYSGFHPTFYSNNQALALPGYFPWYPMSGEHQVAFAVIDEGNSDYGYNSFNRIDKTNISLSIKAGYPIVSNLSEQSPYHFSGQSDSITLFGGQIEKGDDLIVNVFPTYYGKMFTKQDGLKSLNKWYEESLDLLKQNGLDQSIIKNKKIINQPKSLTYFSDLNTLSIFDDYIIAKDGIVSIEQIISREMFEMSTHSKIVRCLMNSYIDKDVESAKKTFLERYNMLQSQTIQNVEFVKRMEQLLGKMGGQEFINEFGEYGFGQTNYQSDEEFLKAMEVKYDKD